MKKAVLVILAIAASVAALAVWQQLAPSRLTAAQQEEQRQAAQDMEAIEAARQETLNDAADLPEEAPAAEPQQEEEEPVAQEAQNITDQDVLHVKFATSKGDVVVELHRDWAPRGVERLVELIRTGYYQDAKFFRVVTRPRPFVVQFGIAADPAVSAMWRERTIQDDPVKESNVAGTLTYAMAGPNTRTTQLFINLSDNRNLDGMGFAPIGKVVEGMDVVRSFNDQYQDAPTSRQMQIQSQGNAFLDGQFPGLDYITSATFVAWSPAEKDEEEAASDETAEESAE